MIVGRKVRFDELFLYFCLPALYSPSINLSLSPIFHSTRTTSSSSNFWYCWLLLPTVCCCNFIRQPARILRLSSWMAFMFKAIMQFLYRCCVWNFTFYRVVHLMTFHLTISLKATSYLIWVLISFHVEMTGAHFALFYVPFLRWLHADPWNESNKFICC